MKMPIVRRSDCYEVRLPDGRVEKITLARPDVAGLLALKAMEAGSTLGPVAKGSSRMPGTPFRRDLLPVLDATGTVIGRALAPVIAQLAGLQAREKGQRAIRRINAALARGTPAGRARELAAQALRRADMVLGAHA